MPRTYRGNPSLTKTRGNLVARALGADGEGFASDFAGHNGLSEFTNDGEDNGPSTTVPINRKEGRRMNKNCFRRTRMCFRGARVVYALPANAPATAAACADGPNAHCCDRERRERFHARQHYVGNEDGSAGRADRREPPSARHHLDDGIVGLDIVYDPASDNTGDYDMVDRLIWRLRNGIGVTYRVAYMVGADGSFGWGAAATTRATPFSITRTGSRISRRAMWRQERRSRTTTIFSDSWSAGACRSAVVARARTFRPSSSSSMGRPKLTGAITRLPRPCVGVAGS